MLLAVFVFFAFFALSCRQETNHDDEEQVYYAK